MKNEKPASMTDHVRDVVAEDIHDGRLLPGDSLDEAQLAERFDVSRTPVREALLQLSAQGLVKIIPRSGIYVARLSLPELFAMFELLAELEAVCAKLAARRMTRDEIAGLREAHEAAGPACVERDPDGYAVANARFHEALYNGCHNPFLKAQIEFIRKRTKVYRQNLFARTARIAVSHADHGRVLEAVQEGDPEAAHKYMLEHIGVGGRDFTEYLSTSTGYLFAEPGYGSATSTNSSSAKVKALGA